MSTVWLKMGIGWGTRIPFGREWGIFPGKGCDPSEIGAPPVWGAIYANGEPLSSGGEWGPVFQKSLPF